MQNKIILQAETTFQEAKNRLAEIEQAEAATVRTENAAKKRIAALQENLPSLLAAKELGADNGAEIAQIKEEISLAEETIRDTPLAMDGLKALKPPENIKLRNAQRLLGKVAKYDSIKNQLNESYSPSLANSLRDYAKILGLEEDCEAFLHQIPQHHN